MTSSLTLYGVGGGALEKLLTDSDNVIDEFFFVGSVLIIGQVFVQNLIGLGWVKFVLMSVPQTSAFG